MKREMTPLLEASSGPVVSKRIATDVNLIRRPCKFPTLARAHYARPRQWGICPGPPRSTSCTVVRCDQVDPAVMPFLRRQRRPPSTSCARLQSRQFHAHAGYAQGSCSMVSDQPAREADQNRRQSRQPRSLRHVPVSRNRRATADVLADPVTHCAIAGARTSVRGPAIKCNGQRRLRCGLMKANQRVPAPRGRRTHSFGSTWRVSRGKLLLWTFFTTGQ